MAYIERETALKIIDNYANTVTEDGKVIVDAIRDIVAVITPTADVVEVVRCKDCKWWHDKAVCRNVTGLNSVVLNPEWFCPAGERTPPKGVMKNEN